MLSNKADVQFTPDELERFEEALKQPEFRDMFFDYMKEISSDENRKLYEQEIELLEKERGNDINWLRPEPQFVVKTRLTRVGQDFPAKENEKVFINVCASEAVQPASKENAMWNIPHAMSRPREDKDNRGERCFAVDCSFNKEAFKLIPKQALSETAVESVERMFFIGLSRSFQYPNIKSKGTPENLVMRSSVENSRETAEPVRKEKVDEEDAIRVVSEVRKPSEAKPCTYSIKYRNKLDYKNFTNDPEATGTSGKPDELVIEIAINQTSIEMSKLNLDVKDKTLVLKHAGEDLLKFNLPYAVDKDKGNAKWFADKRVLKIEIPTN